MPLADRTWLRRALVAALIVGVVAVLWAAAADLREPADPQGARVTQIEIDSAAVGETLPVSVVVPPGAARSRPLLVFLHGHGHDHRSFLDEAFFDALAALGPRAPVVAFPEGSDAYWHDRRRGAWGRWVTHEVIPRVARSTGADRRRVAIGGISMGGFGALSLAQRNPRRFCAVAAHSPAIWRAAGEAFEPAFDDPRDFARHDLVVAARTSPQRFRGTPIWLDTGSADWFLAGQRAFAGALRRAGADIRFHVFPGQHEDGYWARHWGDYLGFYAGELRRCEPR